MSIGITLDWIWVWGSKSLLCCEIVGNFSAACCATRTSTTCDFMAPLVILGVIWVENVFPLGNTLQNPFSFKKVGLFFFVSMTTSTSRAPSFYKPVVMNELSFCFKCKSISFTTSKVSWSPRSSIIIKFSISLIISSILVSGRCW